MCPEAAILVPLQADALPSATAVSDASDDARPDVAEAAYLEPHRLDADAERSVAPAPVVPVQGAVALPLAPLAQPAAVELCKPDAVRSGEQSCAAMVAAVAQSERLASQRLAEL